jgi:hypothetical protein
MLPGSSHNQRIGWFVEVKPYIRILLVHDTAAYEERELPSGHLNRHRLAVLADALEEAGADAELVGHLRGPGPHVRGCWVVDFLTGRG